MKKWTILAGSAAIALLCSTFPAEAQNYPNRPVRFISAYAPGGGAEIGLRLVAQKLTESGWPQVIVENKPGGGGVVAAMAGKEAAPDGYTIFQGDATSLAINATLIKDIPYDPTKDFTPIILKFSFPSVLVVPATSPAKTAAELIAMAKTKQGGLSYATQGVGSGGHLLGTMFGKSLAAPLTTVHYRGSGQAMPDVVAGRVDFILSSYGSARSFVQGGTARVLAVTSKSRLAELPDLPTMTELGHPSVFFDVWFGLVGPAGMPANIVNTIHAAVDKVLKDPASVQKLAEFGLYVGTSTPEQFRDLIRADGARLGQVVRDAGATVTGTN